MVSLSSLQPRELHNLSKTSDKKLESQTSRESVINHPQKRDKQQAQFHPNKIISMDKLQKKRSTCFRQIVNRFIFI